MSRQGVEGIKRTKPRDGKVLKTTSGGKGSSGDWGNWFVYIEMSTATGTEWMGRKERARQGESEKIVRMRVLQNKTWFLGSSLQAREGVQRVEKRGGFGNQIPKMHGGGWKNRDGFYHHAVSEPAHDRCKQDEGVSKKRKEKVLQP